MEICNDNDHCARLYLKVINCFIAFIRSKSTHTQEYDDILRSCRCNYKERKGSVLVSGILCRVVLLNSADILEEHVPPCSYLKNGGDLFLLNVG
jgi:hypothetical protein